MFAGDRALGRRLHGSPVNVDPPLAHHELDQYKGDTDDQRCQLGELFGGEPNRGAGQTAHTQPRQRPHQLIKIQHHPNPPAYCRPVKALFQHTTADGMQTANHLNTSTTTIFVLFFAFLCVCPTFTPAIGSESPSGGAVIPPGQEALVADLLGKGATLPDRCSLLSGTINGDGITANYSCASGTFSLVLTHADRSTPGAIRTKKFSISRRGEAPSQVLDTLIERVRAGEEAFEWRRLAGAKENVEREQAARDNASARSRSKSAAKPPYSPKRERLPWLALLLLGSAALAFNAAWRRRSSTNAALALAGLLLAAGLAEVGTWVWGISKNARESETHLRYTHSAPPLDGISYSAALLRAPDNHDSKRILFIGDSFTEGIGVPSTATFATRIGHTLGIDSYNHGVAGSDTREQHLLWQNYSRHWQPDTLVWVFVLNDLAPLVRSENDLIQSRAPEPTHYGSYLLELVSRVRAERATHNATIQGYRRSLNPETNPERFQHLEQALSEVRKEMQSRGGRTIFVIFPLLWKLDDYPFIREHKNIADTALRAGFEVLDLLPTFKGLAERDLWVSEEDHHPNEEGHALAAQQIVEFVGERATPPRQRSPHPAADHWLEQAQRLFESPQSQAHVRRVASILAAGAALALKPGRGVDEASEERYQRALALALEYQRRTWNP